MFDGVAVVVVDDDDAAFPLFGPLEKENHLSQSDLINA